MTHHLAVEDKEFNLVSTLYHAAQGVKTMHVYIEDAEEAKDEELRRFLEEAQEQFRQVAQKGKTLLRERLG